MAGTMAEISYDGKRDVLKSDDKVDYARMENVIPDSFGEYILFQFCNSKK